MNKYSKILSKDKNYIEYCQMIINIDRKNGLEKINKWIWKENIDNPLIDPKRRQYLDLSSSYYEESARFEKLPCSIKYLENLKKLDLSGNNLKKIPESVFKLKNLKELNLSRTNIKEISSSIGNLQELEILDLRVNQISELPFSLTKCTKLKILYINENNFKKLPNWIGDLGNLEKLSIIQNKLTSLPLSFKKLIKLKVLYINGSSMKKDSNGFTFYHFENFPKEICNFKNLKVLDIRGFSNLPLEINQLDILQKIYLGSLIKVPQFLYNFKKIDIEMCTDELNFFDKIKFKSLTTIQLIRLNTEDDKAWDKTRKLNTKKAYIDYYNMFPEGRHNYGYEKWELFDPAWKKERDVHFIGYRISNE